MAKISIRVGDDLAGQVMDAMSEFHYNSKTAFITDAIRHKLKELGVERKKDFAWHKLLTAHNNFRVIGSKFMQKSIEHQKPIRSRFGLKDLLKHNYDLGQTRITDHHY
jgi:metal-responsive CopG/Arc/MetJ family transcriptional regulator